MLTKYGHLTYCTNIHGGESWQDHFDILKATFPLIKQQVSPSDPLGIGLRLSDLASRDLQEPSQLRAFKDWLLSQDAYVFTMNGFPFGAFHGDVVKAHVHTPDWMTAERLSYTLRLFDILEQLVPGGMDGGISTSPLGYRHGYADTASQWTDMRKRATQQIVDVAAYLIDIRQRSGKTLHLDIEPEPDGVLETGPEFIAWFTQELVPMGAASLTERLGMTYAEAEDALKDHIRLCYDVCHFALGYESHQEVADQLHRHGIKIGKFQISAAIKAELPVDKSERLAIGEAFMAFDEPTYLHQVLAKQRDGNVHRFRDLPEAQGALYEDGAVEWRSHFHVPVFLEDLGLLKSTQSDIIEVLHMQHDRQLTHHLEVETYTWGVLPRDLQLPIADSISRELLWVIHEFEVV
ncbi:metabolite traffic protein EboE [Parapedobacter koreensis]|uniref:Xylose isomerase-like TIM barrel n=1 Tax=Parapedobacter koreensis TaxID=332977 RepID=A0A1H7F3L6_9SPHI|nr:metabolite traffic protein EboE [Parapedobacter koreensis]SEK18882.1 hypothetical protein SAMN05421740_101125 [Parapedobacter koreensis]